MSDSNQDDAPAHSRPKKRRSKLLLLGIPLFLLAAGGAGGWWYVTKSAEPVHAAGDEQAAVAEPTGLAPLEPFVVNLADPGGRKYLRVTIVLLLPDEHAGEQIAKNKLVISRLRSSIIEVLTVRTSAQLASPEGRDALKKAVAETARATSRMDVRDVLFEEFIVQ